MTAYMNLVMGLGRCQSCNNPKQCEKKEKNIFDDTHSFNCLLNEDIFSVFFLRFFFSFWLLHIFHKPLVTNGLADDKSQQ